MDTPSQESTAKPSSEDMIMMMVTTGIVAIKDENNSK
jgi:hypothetical protein